MPGPYDGLQIGTPDLSGPGPLAKPNTETWLGNQDPEDTAGDPTITDDTNVTEETNALPGIGMMAGGGMGAAGANKLGRAKSRLRKLGIYGRGTGLLGRGLQYGNSLNA